MRTTIVLSALVMLGSGCSCEASLGSHDAGAEAGDGGAGDAGADGALDAPDDGCTDATLSGWALETYDDVSVVYRARITPDLEGRPFDLFVELRRFSASEFVGTFPLGAGDDGNYGSCAHCVVAFYGSMFDRGYFAREGSLTLRSDPFGLLIDAVLDGVVLEEVTIGGPALASTPVPGGECVRVAHTEVRREVGPPGWTCDVDRYGDAERCDCRCGIADPDCLDFALPVAGCAASEVCVTVAGGIIGPFFGLNECRADCDRASDAVCPTGEVCVPHYRGDVCEDDPALVDRDADLGDVCAEGAEYCAITAPDGAPGAAESSGFCDRYVRADRLCRIGCHDDGDCDAALFERCYVTNEDASGETPVPFGYCVPLHPEGWTCEPPRYEDGTFCDCGCGVEDTDCYDPSREVRGCAGGEVCVRGACSPPS